MQQKKRSIFRRLLIAFIAVGILTGFPLVFLSIKFNKDLSGVRLEQSVSQQMIIISDYFQREFTVGLQRSLKQIAESDALRDYLSASEDERIVAVKRLETNLLRLQKEYQDYSGVFYIDGNGAIIVSVIDGERRLGLDHLAKASGSEASRATSQYTHLAQLYLKIKTTPVLLSSGNMEWFIPPRDVVIDGPFLDENNRLTILAGQPTIDLDNGGFGGLVVIKMQLDTFVKRLQSVKFYELSPIWLFDSAGKLLVAPLEKSLGLDPAAVLGTMVAEALQFHRTDQGLIAVQDLSIVKEKPVIRVAYAIPSSLIFKDYQSAIYFFALVLAIALAIVGALAYVVSRNFSEPIIELARAAAKLENGELSTRVTVNAGGEIGDLVDSFNSMSSKLQLAYQNRNSALQVLQSTIAHMKNESHAASATAEASATAAVDQPSDISQIEGADDLNEVSAVIGQLLMEREKNVREIQVAKLLADEANSAKGDFLAAMSHEIRTPLNAVIGLADVLATTDLSRKQKQLVTGMENAGEMLLQIINDILDFSRLQSGRVELSDMPIDLNAFMARLMLLVGGLPNASRLDIQWSIDPSVPQVILGDDARLMQILINLVGNAVKFTEEGGIRIEARAEQAVAGAPLIRFSVSDTGPGISEELRLHMFEPFRQGTAERLRPHAGSGLGLAICRKLVMAMGGSIELMPGTGKGACFQILLPMRAGAPAVRSQSEAIAAPSAVRPLRILVAEDTPANQIVIQFMLIGLGHNVTMANNGAEAVEAFQSAHFDAVLLDIQMPIKDGYQAAREIRVMGDAGRGVPIVALTAFTQDSDRNKASECGINYFLSKPIRARDISRLFETMLTNGYLHETLNTERA